MSLKKLPKLEVKALSGVKFDLPSDAMAKHDPSLVFASDDSATITIYDYIGSDGWSEGVTAKRIAGALRSVGDRDVTVSINSPGGDFFEGVAIYNLLREHQHKVTVKVVGLAASAASIIAMAGDDVQIAKSAFLMIHNAWVFAIGNRNDLREAASVLDEFDAAMAGVYSDSTGINKAEIVKMMDGETYMSGETALELGFATSLLPSDDIVKSENNKNINALRIVDTMLAQHGMPRSERRSLLNEIKGGKHDAAATVTHDADLGDVLNLIKSIKGA